MATPARRVIELCYDVISPYSWIVFEVLRRYQTHWNIDVKLTPVLLGGLLKGTGNVGPATVPNKWEYMKQDCRLLGEHFQIPMKQPEDFHTLISSGSSLQAMRFVTAVHMSEPDRIADLSEQFWIRVWSENKADINKPDGIKEAAKKAGFSDAVINDALRKSQSDEVKTHLKTITSQIEARGAFGVPTMFVKDTQENNIMIFGSDRFHILADVIGEEYKGPLNELARS